MIKKIIGDHFKVKEKVTKRNNFKVKKENNERKTSEWKQKNNTYKKKINNSENIRSKIEMIKYDEKVKQNITEYNKKFKRITKYCRPS